MTVRKKNSSILTALAFAILSASAANAQPLAWVNPPTTGTYTNLVTVAPGVYGVEVRGGNGAVGGVAELEVGTQTSNAGTTTTGQFAWNTTPTAPFTLTWSAGTVTLTVGSTTVTRNAAWQIGNAIRVSAKRLATISVATVDGQPLPNSVTGNPASGVNVDIFVAGSSLTDGWTMTGTMAVTGGGNSANELFVTVGTYVPFAADLSVTKTHAGNFTQGQTGATYTIVAQNSGNGATTGTVTVTDTLPAGLVATSLAGTGWACTLAPLACTRSDILPIGGSYPPLTLTVNVSATAPASLTNTAAVAGGGDATPGNNTASDPTTIAPAAPDLTVSKSHTGSFTQGQTGATYLITVSNAGPGATSGPVTLADTLPAGLTATALLGTGWTCTVAPLACTRSDALAAAASYPPLTLTVNVSATAPATLTNTAAVAGGGDATPGNNAASDPTTIAPAAPDLGVSKSHTGSFRQGQTGATYTITVSNSGAGATSGTVTVTDTLPAGLTATAFAGTGWACTVAPLTCTRSDALAPGASYPPLTLTVTVASAAPASVTNSVAVSGGGDATPSNNTISDPTTIDPADPDLTITKTHAANFTQGQTGATYTLTVSNIGGSATSGTVTITDVLPAELTPTAFAGTGWTCSLTPLSCARGDALAAGSSYPALTLTVNVSSTAPASVTNAATVAGGGDTSTNNNSVSDPTIVVPSVPVLPLPWLVALMLLLILSGLVSIGRRSGLSGRPASH